MNSIVFALACLFVALTIQLVVLRPASRRLRAKEQAFRFHALRDQLQIYALDGKIDQSSTAYDFLMFTVNMGIRNAGVMRLREILQVVRNMENKVDKNKLESVVAEVERHDPQIKELASRIFLSLAVMVISNDWLATCAFALRTGIARSWQSLKPVFTLVDMVGSKVFSILTPTRVEAVAKATHYNELGHRLAPC